MHKKKKKSVKAMYSIGTNVTKPTHIIGGKAA